MHRSAISPHDDFSVQQQYRSQATSLEFFAQRDEPQPSSLYYATDASQDSAATSNAEFLADVSELESYFASLPSPNPDVSHPSYDLDLGLDQDISLNSDLPPGAFDLPSTYDPPNAPIDDTLNSEAEDIEAVLAAFIASQLPSTTPEYQQPQSSIDHREHSLAPEAPFEFDLSSPLPPPPQAFESRSNRGDRELTPMNVFGADIDAVDTLEGEGSAEQPRRRETSIADNRSIAENRSLLPPGHQSQSIYPALAADFLLGSSPERSNHLSYAAAQHGESFPSEDQPQEDDTASAADATEEFSKLLTEMFGGPSTALEAMGSEGVSNSLDLVDDDGNALFEDEDGGAYNEGESGMNEFERELGV